MAFRLTLILAIGIVLAMLLAPEAPDRPEPTQQTNVEPTPQLLTPKEDETSGSEVAEAEVEAQPEGGDAVSPGLTVADLETVLDTVDDPASQDQSPDTDFSSVLNADAPTALPGLSTGLTLESAASAVSLAESTGARLGAQPTEQEAAQDAAAQIAQAVSSASQSLSATPSSTEPVAEVLGTNVNLRAGPSTAEAVVGQADYGQRLVLLGEPAPGWSAVRHPDTGSTVYMASRFLQELGN